MLLKLVELCHTDGFCFLKVLNEQYRIFAEKNSFRYKRFIKKKNLR